MENEIKYWEENLELVEGLEIKSAKLARMIIRSYLELTRSEKIKVWVSKNGREAIEWRMERIRKYRKYLRSQLNKEVCTTNLEPKNAGIVA